MSISHSVRRAAVCFGLALASFTAGALAGPDSDFEIRRDQERKNYETMIGNMPVLDVRHLGAILHLTIDNKALVLRTALPTSASDGYTRVRLGDRAYAGLLRVQGGAAAPGNAPVVPNLLQFTLTDYTQPLRITTISVNTQAAYCSINKSSQFPGGGFRNTTIIQQVSSFPESGGSIHLSVNELESDGSSPVNVDLQAGDFFSLVHDHPGECDAFVRPMLQDLGQEGVFAPDPLVAWQVFADTWKPDPAISLRIQDLLPGLDVDDFRLRAQASRALEKLGREGAAVLVRLDRTHLTPEQNARVDLALAPYTQLSPKEATRLRSDATFLLDCLYSDDARLKKAALGRLRALFDPKLEFNVDSDAISRNAAIAILRKRMTRAAK